MWYYIPKNWFYNTEGQELKWQDNIETYVNKSFTEFAFINKQTKDKGTYLKFVNTKSGEAARLSLNL